MRRDKFDRLASQAASVSHAGLDLVRLMAFARRYLGDAAAPLQLEAYPLRGGLETADVFRVQVRSITASCRRRTASFVVKRVSGRARREVQAYETLLRRSDAILAPRLLGAESIGPTTAYLYLEWLTPWLRWPWRESRLAALVLERLADVHAWLPADAFATGLADWDFEAELCQSAWETLELLETVARQEELKPVRCVLPAVRRVVAVLPAMRRQLVAAERTATVLHGDAHPGNVVIRRRGTSQEAVLLDWGRTRLGSPLEDVCSWLQSLGYWEPEVRRYHDTLWRHYLGARGRSTCLDPNLRSLYWLAGACNGLAGALRYHLLGAAASTDRQRRSRVHSVAAVRDWLRIIRRADAHWRN
jgi:hypothetical protein